MLDWEPASLGDERLDGQHRNIVRRLRTLVAALESGKLDEVRATLRTLSLALAEHWRDEERWMENAGYPGISEHARNHDALLRTLADAVEPPPRYDLVEGVSELSEALEVHMRAEDLKLARFFAARANFRAMAEAKAGKGPALTPLPGQLGTLDLGGRTPVPGRTPAPQRMSAPARTPEPGRIPGQTIPAPGKKPGT
ncbi:MAG TPA: hemerythrin family protein [Anaeromyxobacter sp.]